MKDWINDVVLKEDLRLEEFPIAREKIFMAHAGVTVLPRVVARGMQDYIEKCALNDQEFDGVLKVFEETRRLSAELIGAEPEEIALLGPTSLGLSLFANGLDWEPGDEVVCYPDDYPANVYPWMDLKRHGVKVNYLKPGHLGELTPELVEAALTEKTKLVALASCNFLGGYRIDIDTIGKMLHERGILFSLDAIQTVGAFPTRVDHVDFLSADAHKWMLGPMAIGIVYVAKEHFERLRPTLLGAWNVNSPNFITQNEIQLPASGRRYEPGVLNAAGIYGMREALKMILETGIDRIASRLLELKEYLTSRLESRGYEIVPPVRGESASSITTFRKGEADEKMAETFRRLKEAHVSCSHRHDRDGKDYIRLSPHFWNTHEEIDRVMAALE